LIFFISGTLFQEPSFLIIGLFETGIFLKTGTTGASKFYINAFKKAVVLNFDLP
jgi:hypothetical protein